MALVALRCKHWLSVVILSVAESPMRGSLAKASSFQPDNRFFGLGGIGGRNGVVLVILVVVAGVVQERRGVFLGHWMSWVRIRVIRTPILFCKGPWVKLSPAPLSPPSSPPPPPLPPPDKKGRLMALVQYCTSGARSLSNSCLMPGGTLDDVKRGCHSAARHAPLLRRAFSVRRPLYISSS